MSKGSMLVAMALLLTPGMATATDSGIDVNACWDCVFLRSRCGDCVQEVPPWSPRPPLGGGSN